MNRITASVLPALNRQAGALLDFANKVTGVPGKIKLHIWWDSFQNPLCLIKMRVSQ